MPLSRRDLIRAGAAGAALPWLPRLGSRYETRHLVLVAFAGGVRTKEVLGTPQNVPNLMRIASAGVTLPRVRCENTGHYGAALSIFTGNVELLGIRDDGRGPNPTLFEYLRKDAGFAPGEIWLSTAGGSQARLFAHSTHADYGSEYAAQVLDGDGIFNVEFKRLLDSFGRPREDGEADLKVLDAMGAALDASARDRLGTTAALPDPTRTRAIERFILRELSGANARLSGPGAADAKAIRIGANILRAFRPRVLGITLQSHDIAHGSYNGYVEVIRRNDEELGKLWDLIQDNPELRDHTTVMLLPEFGRDHDLNERNGLDHGDSSDDMRYVFMIAAGPDFRRDRVIHKEVRTIDVCPTALELLAHKRAVHSKARVLRELFA